MVAERFCVSLEGSDGGLKIVGDIAEQLAAFPVETFPFLRGIHQFFCQQIERVFDLTVFILCIQADACFIVSGGDLTESFHQFRIRRGDMGADRLCVPKKEEQEDRGAGDEKRCPGQKSSGEDSAGRVQNREFS